MRTEISGYVLLGAASLLLASCAVTPEDEPDIGCLPSTPSP